MGSGGFAALSLFLCDVRVVTVKCIALCEEPYNESYAELAKVLITKVNKTAPLKFPRPTPQPYGSLCLFSPLRSSVCSGAASQQEADSIRQEPCLVVSAAPTSWQGLDYSDDSHSHQCVFRVHFVPVIVLGAGNTVAAETS